MLPTKISMQDESENMLFNFVLGFRKSLIHVTDTSNSLYVLDNGEFTTSYCSFLTADVKCMAISHIQLNTFMEMWFVNKMFAVKSIPRASHVPAVSLTRK
jgi:hypothetical protein